MQKISPFLWFDTNAEEAASFYCSVFKNSKVLSTTRYLEGAPVPAGTALVVEFALDGQKFFALNGGPNFKFTEAISFTITTETQEETDYYWNKLISGGGQESMCGWLKDKFGLSWQVTPRLLSEYIADKDKAKAQRVFNAMMQMRKVDIAALQRAYDGK
jgi:predicted 3-demethylubiquinone-9 3-methyltransferase (glyoxalase superfamily)